jgi:hypothetical protein
MGAGEAVTAKPRRVCGGIFRPDPDLPADHNGRWTCHCGLLGAPGDAHHTAPEPAEDGRMRAAGERSEG